ncbi:hypothetical protein SQ11_10185 [Nitrosospira sp. NpAV]|nr:hypothetical protein SQ11_10185 [Nitrosospira sp. NpAV]
MNVKSMLLYASLVCGGFGAGMIVSPLTSENESAVSQTEAQSMRDCESARGHTLQRSTPRNTPDGGF